MDAFFARIAKASEGLAKAVSDYSDNMPSVREKLMFVEKASAKEDGLNYSDEEIEKLVDKQLENHPFSNHLRQAWQAYGEAWGE